MARHSIYAVVGMVGVLLSTSALAQSPGALQGQVTRGILNQALAAKQDTINLPSFAQSVLAQAKSSNFSGLAIDQATAGGTLLSTIANQAAAGATAMQPASLSSTLFQAQLGAVQRTLAARMSDKLNVMDFGAVGDGVTDDTRAFQATADVATGHINDSTALTPTQKAFLILTGFQGIGAKPNGAVEIDIPARRYRLTASIQARYQPNSAIHWRGAGSSMTELQFDGGIDGLVTTFSGAGPSANNGMERTGQFQGQAIEVTGIHFAANTGIVPAASSGSNIGNGQGYAGAAIKTIALPVVGASTPPMQVYDDLAFTNTNGWYDGANNWKNALYLQDPDSLFVNRLFFNDRSLYSNTSGTVIQIHSTASASGPGHQFLNFDNIDILGGGVALNMDGNDIQGVNISHLTTACSQQGVVWLPPANSLSGSLTLADSSIGAAYSMVHIANAATIFSHHNFFYNVSPPAGTDPIFFYVQGSSQVVSQGDQFAGPLPGAMGAGHSSIAMFVSGYPALVQGPSSIDGDTIANFDTGIQNGGGVTIRYSNDVVSSNTTTCYKDTSSGSSAGLRPQFDGISCGATLHEHDGAGYALAYDWLQQRFFNGSLELGLPGVTSPAGIAGAAGALDFHAQPNAGGTVAGLNDYDVRLIPSGGTDGTNGQGTLSIYAAGGLVLKNGGIVSAGPIIDQSGTHAYVSATGSSFTAVGRRVMIQCAHPTDTYAALTVMLPKATQDQQPFSLSASCSISQVTLVPYSGQTTYLASAALAPGQMINLIYDQNTGPLAAPGWE